MYFREMRLSMRKDSLLAIGKMQDYGQTSRTPLFTSLLFFGFHFFQGAGAGFDLDHFDFFKLSTNS
jgi:hypothetical protein